MLRYTVSYTNTGSDAAANFAMRDAIPAGSTYVPGSLRITAGPQAPASPTDALGDDAAEFNSGTGEVVFRLGAGGNATTGGRIAPGETDTVTFDVTINANVAPGQQIINQANATFTGFTLGTAFTDVSPQVVNTVAVPSLVITKTHSGSPGRRAADDFHAVGLERRERADGRLDGDRHRPVPGGLVQLDRQRRRCRLELRDQRADADVLAQRRAGWERRLSADPGRCDGRGSGAGDDRQHRDRVGGRVSSRASASDGGGANGLADVSLIEDGR